MSERPDFFGTEFHGQINREMASLILRSDGEYLVRESAYEPGQYCLAMKINGCLKHYKLYHQNGYYNVGEKRFTRLNDLVADGIINMFIEHNAKNYLETMTKKSVYARLRAAQYEEIDARTKQNVHTQHIPSPYAECQLNDRHYMTSSSSGQSSLDQFSSDQSVGTMSSADPVYESIIQSDEEDSEAVSLASLSLHPNPTQILSSCLTSKSSIGNMSTGHASECSSSDSYTSPHGSPTHVHAPPPSNHIVPHIIMDEEIAPKKKKTGLMTSLKRSLSFSHKNKRTRPPKTRTNIPNTDVTPHCPDYEKKHNFTVSL